MDAQARAKARGDNPDLDPAVLEAHGAYKTEVEHLQKATDEAFFDAVSTLKPFLESGKTWTEDDLRMMAQKSGPVGEAATIILGDKAIMNDVPEEDASHNRPGNFAKLDLAWQYRSDIGWNDDKLRGGDGRFSLDDVKAFLKKEAYDDAIVAVTRFPLETQPQLPVDKKTIVAAAKILARDWDDKGVGTGGSGTLDKDEFKSIKERFAGDRELTKAAAIIAKVAEAQGDDFKELHQAAGRSGRDENVSYRDLRAYIAKYDGKMDE